MHKEKGIDKIGRTLYTLSFHSLRKTLGSFLRDAGVPMRDIADILGHNDTVVTMIYTHSAFSLGKKVRNYLFSNKTSEKNYTDIEKLRLEVEKLKIQQEYRMLVKTHY